VAHTRATRDDASLLSASALTQLRGDLWPQGPLSTYALDWIISLRCPGVIDFHFA